MGIYLFRNEAAETVSNSDFTGMSDISSALLISAVDLTVFHMSTQEENGRCFDSLTSIPPEPHVNKVTRGSMWDCGNLDLLYQRTTGQLK